MFLPFAIEPDPKFPEEENEIFPKEFSDEVPDSNQDLIFIEEKEIIEPVDEPVLREEVLDPDQDPVLKEEKDILLYPNEFIEFDLNSQKTFDKFEENEGIKKENPYPVLEPLLEEEQEIFPKEARETVESSELRLKKAFLFYCFGKK